MTDTPTELHETVLATFVDAAEHAGEPIVDQSADAIKPAKGKNRFAAAQPVLEKLFELYPNLFGQRFLPLKLGVYQDLLMLHPVVFNRDDLKLALGVHTRSTRYLQAVAVGLPRHDLQGLVVEPVAPEHVLLSIVEVFTRRQARTVEDLLPKLQNQMAAAYEASDMARADFLARIGTLDEVVSAVLEEAMGQVDLQRARRAALVKAFETSGKSVEEFAEMFGMELREVKATLAVHQKYTK